MKNPTLKARIVKIEPGAGYEDKIYDQYVYIELLNGQILDVFDYEMIANSQMIGKVKDITISASIGTIVKLSETKFGIVPHKENIEYEPSGHGHVFYGKIEEVDEKYCDLVVDTGVGGILATPRRDQLKDLNIGDFVRVFGNRTDLDGIHW
ncbi:MAG: hypothetical protein U9P81_07585 [Euryarchaeota archaeon]|nr:hypothetical protein [Euryarchaeota archaeon]